MEQGGGERRRRGPPKTKKTRTPPVEEYSEEISDDTEWYQDVVDNSGESGESGESGGFGGFAVKRPQMNTNDPAESEQWERYFEKQYHGKSKQKRESIEENWEHTESDFEITSLFNGYRALIYGLQAFMYALPLMGLSIALIFAGNELGGIANLILAFLAICGTTVALIQMITSAINQSLREREISRDGADIPLMTWTDSIKSSSRLFSELLVTFILMWSIMILGLYLVASGIPDLSLPSINPDNLSAGILLYILGGSGSLLTLIGTIPYVIEATIQKS